MSNPTLPGILPVDTADFSPCKLYRYTLWRKLANDTRGTCVFIMLNPSTATAETNDPTVRRCIGYATDWGFSDLLVLNAFAYRATDPDNMKAFHAPIGIDNDRWIRKSSRNRDNAKPLVCRIIVAWGKDGIHQDRDEEVLKIISESGRNPLCLGTNQDGTPKHPLYLRKDLQPTPYLGREHHREK